MAKSRDTRKDVKKKPAKTSKLAMDRELAKKLWKVSEEMVGGIPKVSYK